MTTNLNFKSRRRGTTAAALGGLALASVLLLCGAGNAPIENFTPQGAMQADLNAGGHSLTNAATVSATNVAAANLTVNGKALGMNNALTLAGTDGSTLNVGAGGTLGSNAFTSTVYVPATTTVNNHALSSNVTVKAGELPGSFRQWALPPMNHVIVGDSLQYPFGTGPIYFGLGYGPAGYLASNPLLAFDNVIASSHAGGSISNASADYFPGGVVTTGNVTNGSSTVTITGTTTGITGLMCVGGPSIPFDTTATISGTTVTLYNASTGSTVNYPGSTATGVTLYFCTPSSGTGGLYTFDSNKNPVSNPLAASYPSFYSRTRLWSPLVTGVSASLVEAFGTNDSSVNSGCAGVVTTGSNTITGYTGTTANGTQPAVGYYIFAPGVPPAAVVTAVTGSDGNYSLTWTGTPATQTGTVAMTAQPQSAFTNFTTGLSSYLTLVQPDGWNHIFICTIPPSPSLQSNYVAIQYFNNYIKTTYGTGAVANVSVIDVGGAAEFQPANPNRLDYFYTDLLHETTQGYQVWADYIANALSTVFYNPTAPKDYYALTRSSIQDNWLSSNVPLLHPYNNAANKFNSAATWDDTYYYPGTSTPTFSVETSNNNGFPPYATWRDSSGNVIAQFGSFLNPYYLQGFFLLLNGYDYKICDNSNYYFRFIHGAPRLVIGTGEPDDLSSYIQNWGHYTSYGTAPTIAAGAGAGTSPTVSIAGTDSYGKITIVTGTTPSTGTVATVTFNSAYAVAPTVDGWVPKNAAATALLSTGAEPYPNSESTTTFTISSGATALAASTTYVFSYHVN